MNQLSRRIGFRSHHRIAKLSSVLTVLVFVAGCATTAQQAPIEPNTTPSEQTAANPTDPTLRIVAVDLISVLSQLPGYETWSMTAQVSPTSSKFGEALVVAMRDAGYGVQRVSADQGLNYLEYRKNVTLTDSSETTAFELEVRDVTVSRNYQWVGSRWIPSSAVRIRGVKPTPVNIYNDLHSKQGITTTLVTGVQFLDKSGRVVASQANTTKISGDTEKLVEEQSVLNKSRASVFTRQRSNASSDHRTYRPISEVTLTFPSKDPNVLGEMNKLAIMTIMKQMDSASDRFLIQGCHSQSLAWDGTELLSLERQLRVNQELLVAGVNPEAIQESGCSQENTQLNLPRKSIRLTLQRATQPL